MLGGDIATPSGLKETMNTGTAQTDLPSILTQCWMLLTRGKADRKHGFHHPIVASVTAEGTPRSRVVVLRGVDVAAATLRFHTDVRSAKWGELEARPAVSALFYDEHARVQLRVDGLAGLHHGDAVAGAAWTSSQRMSRICYGMEPGPGVLATGPDTYMLPESDDAIAMGQVNFGAVVIKVKRIEWLFLRSLQNQRALFDLEAGAAHWLVP
jgi:pyridoxamine 5'-phosphate oxidase